MMFIDMFPQRLKYARKKAKYTMTRAAKKLGILQPTISRYETGKSIPAVDRVAAMAELYGVSMDWLCGLGEDVNNGCCP